MEVGTACLISTHMYGRSRGAIGEPEYFDPEIELARLLVMEQVGDLNS